MSSNRIEIYHKFVRRFKIRSANCILLYVLFKISGEPVFLCVPAKNGVWRSVSLLKTVYPRVRRVSLAFSGLGQSRDLVVPTRTHDVFSV